MRSLGRGLRRSEFGGVPGRIPELNDTNRPHGDHLLKSLPAAY